MSRRSHVLIMMTSTMSNEPRVRRESAALAAVGVRVTALGIRVHRSDPAVETMREMEVRRIDLWDVRMVRAIKCMVARTRAPSTSHDGIDGGLPTAAARAASEPGNAVDWVGDVRTLLHWLAATVQFTLHGIRHRVDAYHPHDLPPLLAALMLAAVRRRPVIYESHEYWSAKFPDRPLSRRIGRALERFGCRRADLVLVVNDSIADRMRDEFDIPRPIVVPNVPDVRPAQHVAPTVAGTPLEVLYHGILVPGRGLEQLVDAVGLMRHPARLVVRGPGELRNELVARAAARGLAERFQLAESVPLDELVQAASSSHVGVLPFEPRLGYDMALPNKLFEYMAAGLAIVSSDVPEIRRLLVEVGNGIVCADASPHALAEALDALAADPDRLALLRGRSLEAARRSYTWSVQQHRLLDVYLPLLHG